MRQQQTKIVDEIEELLGLLYAAFAHLNLIHPNKNEKQKARQATDTLLAAWRKANLSIMLKAHLMESHVGNFNEKWGIGDK